MITRAGHKSDILLGPFGAPPRPGHVSGPGGGEPPSPELPKMRYVCFLEGVEQDALDHGYVCQGLVAETKAAKGGGGTVDHGSGLPGLQETLGYCNGF